MKYWLIILIGIFGIVLFIIGTLFKIQSWTYSNELITFGIFIVVVALVLIGVKVFKDKKFDR